MVFKMQGWLTALHQEEKHKHIRMSNLLPLVKHKLEAVANTCSTNMIKTDLIFAETSK